MPGSKRRMDEDTWLIFQSKKTKTSLLTEKIFESTLAKLRHGARAVFNPAIAAEPPVWAGNNSPGSSGSESNPVGILPANSNSTSAANNVTLQIQGKDCVDCQRSGGQNRTREKCSFCDHVACHVSPCAKCGDNFCNNCSIKRYDDPLSDAVTCYSCL